MSRSPRRAVRAAAVSLAVSTGLVAASALPAAASNSWSRPVKPASSSWSSSSWSSSSWSSSSWSSSSWSSSSWSSSSWSSSSWSGGDWK